MITARLSINQALTVRAVPKTGLGSCMACLLQQRETTWADQTLRIHQVWTSNPRNQTNTPIPGADHRLRIKLPIPAQEHWKLTQHQASCLSTAVDAPAPLNFIFLSSRFPDFLSSASLIPLMEELEHGREAACSHLIKATSIHTPRAELALSYASHFGPCCISGGKVLPYLVLGGLGWNIISCL